MRSMKLCSVQEDDLEAQNMEAAFLAARIVRALNNVPVPEEEWSILSMLCCGKQSLGSSGKL